MLKTLTFVLFAFILTSCSTRITDFTVISTKNVDLSKLGTYKRTSSRIVGEDKAHVIILIPTKFNITVKDALDKAIESTKGCVALVDGVVRAGGWYIPLLYGQNYIIVEGTGLIDPSIATLDSKFIKIEIGEDGNVLKSENISEEEYNKLK